MANNIKGITIELNGNAENLNSALKGVNKSAGDAQSELREVNKQLKFDPSSTELLTQKQTILAKEIDATKEKLNALKISQKSVTQQFKDGDIDAGQYKKFLDRVDTAKESLEKLKSKQAELEKQYAAGEIDQGQYKKFQESVAQAEEKVRNLESAESESLEQRSKNGDISAEKFRALQREVEKTESQLTKLEKQAKSASSVLGSQISTAGAKVTKAGKAIEGVGKKLLPVSTAVAAIGVAAVSAGDDFEAQMSRVSAISGATGNDLKALNEQALKLGQDTAYSATEAAEGMENLASAGFSTKEIMEAMPGMLDLAASSGEDLANSADIAASTLRGFGLSADQAGHVADVLAKNAADTNAAVADTGAAMKYIAPVAKNAGWSLEQVTAAIGEMADAGIKGEQAGTTLRGALTNLMNPSSTAAKAMQSIGFSAYDTQGKMKPLSQIIDELNQKTSGLTNEQRDNVIATITGTNALSGMQVLLKDGKGNLDKLTTSLKKSDGAASKMASTMQGNTKGAIEQMKGALETAAIKIQQILAPTVTKIAKQIGALAEKFSALSPTMQNTVIVVAGLVAALAPLLIIIGKITQGSGDLMQGIGFMMAHPILIWIAAIAAAAVLVITHWKQVKTFFTGLWNHIKGLFGNIGGWFKSVFTAAANGVKSAWSGIKDFFSGMWNGIKKTTINIWNGILTFFKTLPGKFLSAAKSIGQAIIHGFDTAVDFLKSLPKKALGWGKDFIQGLIEGIKSMVRKVTDAVKGVASTIRSFLHFSKPDEGPLADYESWMPDFMEGLAKGIEASKRGVIQSMQSLAAGMSISPTVRTAMEATYGYTASPVKTAASTSELSGAAGGIIVYQRFQGKTPSPAETARQTRNGLQQVVKKLRK